MAAFIVKGKKGAGTITREADLLVVGTRSSCGLSLEDPMVADEHCAVLASAEGFLLEDLGSSSGTFLNGRAVSGRVPIPNGAEIVIGVSRLKAEVDLEKKQITLTLKEKEFFYDKKEDPLAWVRTEVSFGRFPPVRVANLVAGGALVLILPLCFFGRSAEIALDPGPLCPAHKDALAKGSGSCASCHVSFHGTPADRCGECHRPIAKDHHPFGRWESNSCNPCHTEHRGDAPGGITTRAAASTCLDCHGEMQARRPPAPPSFREAGIPFNTFSHKDHVEGQGISCAACHALSETPRTAEGVRRDFQPVLFETCMTCHAQGSTADRKSRKAFHVAWHGTDGGGEKCLQCHATVHGTELRTVEKASRELLFTVKMRSHRAEFKGGRDGEACADCHRDGAVAGGKERSAPFLHGTHLPALVGHTPAERTALNQRCEGCHAEQRASRRLASPVYQGAAGDCLPCHREEGKNAQRPTPLLPPSASGPRPVPRPDFPHEPHLGKDHSNLRDGCFTCHLFAASSDLLRAVPATKQGASSCLPCHQGHRDIAGGACFECHREGDPVYSGRTLPRSWPDNSAFLHQSPGHADLVRKGDCLACHGSRTASARTVADVPIPDESQQACRDCHLGQKARFHWR